MINVYIAARKKFHINKYIHSRIKSADSKENLKAASKKYKNVMDESIKYYSKELSNKLKNLRSNNTQEYWKILNSHNKKKNKNGDCAADIGDL